MHDRQSARLMGMAATGNGRRQSYAHLPMPRMTNTGMLAGADTNREEMIASTARGLYCANFGGGQVDITNGKFVFQCTEAYLIEDGKITAPVKGATLIGDGPSALTRVTMIGDDFAFDPGIGVCGKAGQGVPVGVGQPSLKITGLTVGGDGARPASKDDGLDQILKRIPASSVLRIDVIRGGAPGIDMQGKTVLANVVRRRRRGAEGDRGRGRHPRP